VKRNTVITCSARYAGTLPNITRPPISPSKTLVKVQDWPAASLRARSICCPSRECAQSGSGAAFALARLVQWTSTSRLVCPRILPDLDQAKTFTTSTLRESANATATAASPSPAGRKRELKKRFSSKTRWPL
jgi:hypothetical protein